MTSEDEAFHAVGLLISGVSMWPENATDGFVRSFIEHAPDFEALRQVCDRIARTWGDRPGRPTTKQVLDEYRDHPRVAEARAVSAAAAMSRASDTRAHCGGTGMIPGEDGMKPCPRCNPYLADVFADSDKWEKRYRRGISLPELHPQVTLTHGQMKVEVPMPVPCRTDTDHDPGERVLPAAEGYKFLRDEYKAMTGREIGEAPVPNPVYAIDVIQRVGHFDPEREVWVTTYAKVLAEFREDQARTRASLKAIGKRLTHASNGNLTLHPEEPVMAPDPSYKAPTSPSTPEPSPPSERPLDPTGLLSDALGDTRRRMEEEGS